MNKLIQYLKDVRVEMRKVSWPSRNEIVAATTLVSIVSIVVAIVIKVFDMALSQVLGFLLNL